MPCIFFEFPPFMQSGRTEMALGAAERIATINGGTTVAYVLPTEDDADNLRQSRRPNDRVFVMGLARFQRLFRELRPRLVVFDNVSYMSHDVYETAAELQTLMNGAMAGPTQIILIP